MHYIMDLSAINCTVVIAIVVYILLLLRICFCKLLIANVQLLSVCVRALSRRKAPADQAWPLVIVAAPGLAPSFHPVMMTGKCKRKDNEKLTRT